MLQKLHLIVLTLLLMCNMSFAEAARDDVLVIVNDNSADSPQLGTYYLQARGINPANIVHVNVPDSYFISWNDFRNLRDQLINFMQQNTLDDPTLTPAECLDGEPPYYCQASMDQLRAHTRIRYLVTTRGVPTRMLVDGSTLFEPNSPSSVDNYLKYWLLNYFTDDVSLNFTEREVAFADGRGMRTVLPSVDKELIVGRIDGLDLTSAKSLVDRIIAVESTGIYGIWYGSTQFFRWNDASTGLTVYPKAIDNLTNNNLLGWRYALGLWNESLPECINYLNVSGGLPGGKAPAHCRIKLNDDVDVANQTTAGISYPAPGNAASRQPNPIDALGYQGWLDGQVAIGSFNSLLQWRKNDICTVTQCDTDACRATSTDIFKELNTTCVGGADGFMGYNQQSYPYSYLTIWPTSWYQSDKTGANGWTDGGHGDLYQLAFPEVRSDDGFIDVSNTDTNSLWFRNADQLATPLCFAGSDFSVSPTVPCVDQRRLVLTQRVTLTSPQTFDLNNPQTYRISLRYKTSNIDTTVPLQVRFFVHETGAGNAQIDYGMKPLATLTTVDSTGWTLAEVTFTLDSLKQTVGSYDGIKITLDTPVAFAGELGIDVVSVQETTQLIELLDNGSFSKGHQQVATGDHAANFLDRLGGVAAWGAVGHHESAGCAFCFNGLEMLTYFLRGLPLGDAVWFNESHNSGILYGDPLYSPAAVRINPVNVCDTMAGVTDLFGSTVNGRNPALVSTTYQVEFCPGNDFFDCDQAGSWLPTGISGTGGNENQFLGSWDSSTQAAGNYVLRLAVTSNNNTISGRSQTINDYYPVTIAATPPGPSLSAGSLQMCAATNSVAEDGLTASINVIRIGGSTGPISVSYLSNNGSATAGSDFTAVNGILNFADGDTVSRTISVPILDDTIFEGDETLDITLSNATGGAGLGSIAKTVLTILDNETPAVSFGAPIYSVNEGGVTVTITVTRDSGIGGTAVRYATNDGSATAGSDYTSVSGTIVFASGELSRTIAIPILDDSLYEGDETLNINLIKILGRIELGSPASAVITINDNDPVPTVNFSSSAQSVLEGNIGNTAVTVTANLSVISSQAVTVPFTLGGTASNLADHDAASGSITIPAGSPSGVYNFNVLGDTLDESNETVIFNMGTPSNATVGTIAVHTVTLTDDDATPSLQFSAASYTVSEAAPSASITVTRSANTTGAVSVDFASSDASATAGSDYTLVSGTLNFADGVTSQSFSVPIINDNIFEGNETLNLILSKPVGATLGQNSAILTIIENDPIPPAGSIQFSAPAYGVAENGTAVSITVSRFGGSFGAVSVNYATVAGGSATAGADYTAVSGTLNFANGDTTARTFNVPITDDNTYEGDETVNLALSGVTGGARLAAPSTAIVTINDNEAVPPAGSLQLSSPTYSVNENGITATITVTRIGGSFGTASVSYASIGGGSATAGADYTAVSGTLNFADGDASAKTFSVPIIDDVTYEGNETINLILSDVAGEANLGILSSAILTILEDDTAPPADSNNDGLSDADAIALGLDPNDTDGDSDNDGLSDVIEVGGDINNPLDSDFDGIIDALEPGSSATDATTASGIEMGYGATASISNVSGGTLSAVSKTAVINGTNGFNFPYGALSFTANTTPGEVRISVRLSFTTDLPADVAIFKTDGNGNIIGLVPNQDWIRLNNRTIYLTLTDGGPFDQDGLVDGKIVDPLALGVSTTSSMNTGGSGGAIDLWLLMVFGFLVMIRDRYYVNAISLSAQI